MNAPVIDVKEMLEYYESELSSGVVLYPIFIGKEPASPADTITIFETGVMAPQLTFDRDEIYEYPSVQIRVRSTSYLDGWEMISAIKNLLHGRASETWNDAVYTLVRCSSGPFLLDYDKNQMVRFVVNFYLQRHEA